MFLLGYLTKKALAGRAKARLKTVNARLVDAKAKVAALDGKVESVAKTNLARAELEVAESDVKVVKAKNALDADPKNTKKLKNYKDALKAKSSVEISGGEETLQNKVLKAEVKEAGALFDYFNKESDSRADIESALTRAQVELDEAKVQADLERAIGTKKKPVEIKIIDQKGRKKTVKVSLLEDDKFKLEVKKSRSFIDHLRSKLTSSNKKIEPTFIKSTDIRSVINVPRVSISRLSQEELTEEGFSQKIHNFCLAVKEFEKAVEATEGKAPVEGETEASK